MEVIKLKIDEVIPYERNPRKNDGAVESVAESIKQCGYCSPIIIDENNVILCGHTRLKALKKLGYKEVECVRKEGMTEEQKKKYRILDNKTAEIAEWDFDILEQELKDLDFGEFDFGFDMSAFEEKKEIVEDEAPEVDEESEPITQLGDIWQLGNHRLMCGDSTDDENFKVLMAGKEARLCVTSPPYGVGMEYEEKGIEPWRKTISGVIETITNHCRVICWNIGDLFATETQFIEPTSMYSTEYMRKNGFDLLYSRIWKKQGANFNGVNPYHLVSMKPVQEYEWILGYAKKTMKKITSRYKNSCITSLKKAN